MSNAAATKHGRRDGEPAPKKKRGPYTHYPECERVAIWKQAHEHGTAATLREFRKKYPKMIESTVRTLKKKYEETLTVLKSRPGYDPKTDTVQTLSTAGPRRRRAPRAEFRGIFRNRRFRWF